MPNPTQSALNKAKGQNTGNSSVSRAFQKLAKKGVQNKMSGIVIKTDPTTTALGNRTCRLCLNAKRTGAPLPPQHRDCRCYIQKL